MTDNAKFPHPKREVDIPTIGVAQKRDAAEGTVSEPLGCSPKERDDNYRAVITRLNDRWRVIVCRDHIQWILQKREASRWRNRSFCMTRAALLREVLRHCGDINPNALGIIRSLPEQIE